jgi:hypothetical protein
VEGYTWLARAEKILDRFLIDKVNRYRTIAEWPNGNSNSQKRNGKNC